MLVSPAGRDNTDEFFSMSILPVHMHHQQNCGNSGFNRDCAERVPSLFAGLIDPVQSDQTSLIFKNQRRQLE
jgi:hypothetical protein